ncbi:MAG: B12-binding domain-containing radical SAM protein [Planctomycetota bacterium]|jgi:anaerobic magnesium-protoporphyrin IX monomethyl ester cyclase
MGKAILINPSYFRTYGSNEGGIAFPVYPILSLSAIGGALKARGHQIKILDLSYREYDPAMIRQVILDEKPDAVGITATTPLANQMRDISFLVKDISQGILTVAGGAHPSALPLETMKESSLDAVVAGEGDFALADLLDGKDRAAIPGLYWRNGDTIRVNMSGGLLEDLDDLPMPAWEDYPPESNAKMTRIIARYSPVSTIEFSRGCVFQCDFCGSKNTMGLGYRKKSPDRCAEELLKLQSLGFREAVLVDDIFTSDNEWAARVCEAILQKGVKMAWTCTNGIRVDSANPELFALMKRAGCYRVYFGFESGNENVLQAFGKGGRATLEKGIEAVEMARDAGLEPNGFFLVGLTGDTEESMRDTIDYARTVRLDTMKCGMTTPYPGTPMFHALRKAGRIKTFDWDQYTVYNKAEEIYDHPTLAWETIKRYFKKFYVEVYFKNPRYMWRRLVFMLKNNEIFWNVFYTLKFFRFTFWGKEKAPEKERYEFEARWRPLDTRAEDEIGSYDVPRAKSGTSRRRALAD